MSECTLPMDRETQKTTGKDGVLGVEEVENGDLKCSFLNNTADFQQK